jgi:hypothetical protein
LFEILLAKLHPGIPENESSEVMHSRIDGMMSDSKNLLLVDTKKFTPLKVRRLGVKTYQHFLGVVENLKENKPLS